jgi:hypothetical protein
VENCFTAPPALCAAHLWPIGIEEVHETMRLNFKISNETAGCGPNSTHGTSTPTDAASTGCDDRPIEAAKLACLVSGLLLEGRTSPCMVRFAW